jgi:hypothetical protein
VHGLEKEAEQMVRPLQFLVDLWSSSWEEVVVFRGTEVDGCFNEAVGTTLNLPEQQVEKAAKYDP